MDFLCKISRHPSDCDTQERTANNSFMFKDNTPSIRSMRLMQSRVKTSPAGPLAPPTACRQSARPQAHQRPLLTSRSRTCCSKVHPPHLTYLWHIIFFILGTAQLIAEGGQIENVKEWIYKMHLCWDYIKNLQMFLLSKWDKSGKWAFLFLPITSSCLEQIQRKSAISKLQIVTK